MKAGSMKSISTFSWKRWIYILGNWSLDPNISYSYPAPGSDSWYEKWSLLEVHVDSFTAVKCTKPIRICFCHRHITIIRKAIVQAFHSLHTSLLFTFPHSSFPDYWKDRIGYELVEIPWSTVNMPSILQWIIDTIIHSFLVSRLH